MTIPELLFNIETEMLSNMMKELQVGKATPARWKAERLKAMGKLNTTNLKLIKKYESLILTGTVQEVAKAQADSLYRIDTIYKKAIAFGIDIAPPQTKVSEAMQKIQSIYSEQGSSEMNYTMQGLLHGATSGYKEIIEKTTYKYLTGVVTLDKALQDTCTQWIHQKGILPILDSAGREWSPESYSRMILRTNNRNVATKTQMQRNKEYGNDLIEISSHGGARELCAPYQGRIFSQNGKDKSLPPLSSTSISLPAGIFRINCRHDAYPYIKGISVKTFDPMPFNRKEYNLTQQQRRLEVDIRNRKRELDLLKKSGATEKTIVGATTNIKNSQSNMRNFIENTGARRYPARERIIT